MRNAQPEYTLQKQVCQFIRLQYPKVFFLSDAVSALNLTMPQASRNKAIQHKNFKTPDIIIFEARHEYNSLFIELKAKSIFKKDGFTLLNNPHVLAQLETIKLLRQKGFRASIQWNFDAIIKEIRWYLDGEK